MGEVQLLSKRRPGKPVLTVLAGGGYKIGSETYLTLTHDQMVELGEQEGLYDTQAWTGSGQCPVHPSIYVYTALLEEEGVYGKMNADAEPAGVFWWGGNGKKRGEIWAYRLKEDA